jgi:hypothetical protein
MPFERQTHHQPAQPAQPAAAGDREVERRLRALASACAAPAAAALVASGMVGWMAARGGSGAAVDLGNLRNPGNSPDWQASPPFDSFLIALGAMLLVLLASAVHGRILRRQGSGRAPAERLRAYSWATGVAFAMLAAAVALGAALALGGRAPFYGLVICLASLAVMAARWPRRATFDLVLSSGGWPDAPRETTDGPRPGP